MLKTAFVGIKVGQYEYQRKEDKETGIWCQCKLLRIKWIYNVRNED